MTRNLVIKQIHDEATPWILPIVVIPKSEPGQIRVCTDMRKPNLAIERERHITPTVSEVISDLNGAAVRFEPGLQPAGPPS